MTTKDTLKFKYMPEFPEIDVKSLVEHDIISDLEHNDQCMFGYRHVYHDDGTASMIYASLNVLARRMHVVWLFDDKRYVMWRDVDRNWPVVICQAMVSSLDEGVLMDSTWAPLRSMGWIVTWMGARDVDKHLDEKDKMLQAMNQAGYLEYADDYVHVISIKDAWVFVSKTDEEGYLVGIFYEATVSSSADFSSHPLKEWDITYSDDPEPAIEYAEGYARAINGK